MNANVSTHVMSFAGNARKKVLTCNYLQLVQVLVLLGKCSEQTGETVPSEYHYDYSK